MKHPFFLSILVFAAAFTATVIFYSFPLPAIAATDGITGDNFASSDVPNILQEYTANGLGETAKKVFRPFLGIWDPLNEKLSDWWQNNTSGPIKEWIDRRVKDIKSGLKEEQEELRQELGGSVFHFLQTIWQNIRDKF